MTIEEDCYLKFQVLYRLPEAERAAELAKLKVEAPDVYSFVEDLLAEPVENESFFGGMEAQKSLVASLSNSTSPDENTHTTNFPSLDRYVLTEVLGEGGMGVVYRARQTHPVERAVAVKIVHPGLDSAHVLRRFEQERRVLSRMEHANIARVFDAGETQQGRPFIAMELIEGCSITDYCDIHRLTVKARLSLFQVVCQAVQHAHNKGIVHRDIKPSNVLVMLQDGTPTVKVIDFGVAKALTNSDDAGLLTQTSQMLGTPLYMSPEQASLGIIDVDTRSDVYSLGLLLYELLTGVLPMDPEHARQIGIVGMQRVILETDAPRPSHRLRELTEGIETIAANRQLPPNHLAKAINHELDWMVMRAIEKKPARRYQSPSEMTDEIARYLQGEPIEACPPSTGYRLNKFVQRNRLAAYTSLALLLGLLLAVAGTSWQAYRAILAEAETAKHLLATQEQKRKTTAALNQAERKEREVRWNLYVAKLNPMIEAIKEQDFPRLQALLDETTPAVGDQDYRGWEWYFLEDQMRQARRNFGKEGSKPSNNFAISEASRTLAARLSRHEIGLWDLDTQKLLRQRKINAVASTFDFSNNGDILALGTEEGEVMLVDTETFQVTTRINPFSSTLGLKIRDINWSSDSSRVAFCDWYGNLASLDSRGKDIIVHREAPDLTFGASIDWHPKKPVLAIGLRFGERQIYDLEDGSSQNLPQVSLEVGWGTQWSPSGSRIAVAEGDQIRIMNPDGSDPHYLFARGRITDLEWFGDEVLVSVDAGRSLRVWDVSTGKELSRRFLAVGPIQLCKLDSSRQTILFNDNHGSIFSAALYPSEACSVTRISAGNSHPSEEEMSRDDNQILRLMWSPNDTRIAAISENIGMQGRYVGTASILAASSGKQQQAWMIDLCKGMSWTADGQNILLAQTDHKLILYDSASGLPLEFASCDLGSEPRAYWSHKTDRIATYFQNGKTREGLRFRQARTLEEIGNWDEIRKLQVRDAKWNNSGDHLIAAGYGRLVHVNAFGKLLGETPEYEAWFSVDWHPSDEFFAAGTEGGDVAIFRSNDLHEEIRLRGHRGAVEGLSFSPCGRRLASASLDGTVRIWDMVTGSELLRLEIDGIDEFCEIAWSHDGQQLAAGSNKRDVVVWGTNTQRNSSPDATIHKETNVNSPKRPYSQGFPKAFYVPRRRWRDWYLRLDALRARGDVERSVKPEHLSDITDQIQDKEDRQALATAWLAMVRGKQDGRLAVLCADELLNWLPHVNGTEFSKLRIQAYLARAYRLMEQGQTKQTLSSLKEAEDAAERLVQDVHANSTAWRLRIAVHLAELIANREAAWGLAKGEDVRFEQLTDTIERRMELGQQIWERVPESCFHFQSSNEDRTQLPWLKTFVDQSFYLAIGRKDWEHAFLFGDLFRRHVRDYIVHYSVVLLQAYLLDNEGASDNANEMRIALEDHCDDTGRFFICWANVLVPGDHANFDNSLRLAEDIVRRDPESRRKLRALGGLRMRHGQYRRAQEIFKEVRRMVQSHGESDTYLAFLEAINQWHLGNRENAREMLKEAIQQGQAELNSSPTWNRRLTIELFQREAEQLFDP